MSSIKTLLLFIIDKIFIVIPKSGRITSLLLRNRIMGDILTYINFRYIHLLKSKIIQSSIYEYPLPVIIPLIIKNGDIVIDIGAHYGEYTIFFSRLVGEKGKVYAFEPDPRNFYILSSKSKKYSNIIVINKAVGDKSSRVKFYLDSFSPSSTMFVENIAFKLFNSIEIEMISFDEYFKDFDKNIALIKMDVQGSEPLVIKGMKNLIKKVNAIMFEFWPYGIVNAGFSPIELINELKRNNFLLFYIDENLKFHNINEIINKIDYYTKDKNFWLNIIAIRKSNKR
jgi:FkbM family methyltransferase